MTEKKLPILYVDDDPRQLTAFKAAFRRDYDVYTANSAAEGKLVLKTTPIDIILTDQRMPETTGVEFLESTVTEFPDLIRILVTGYADLKDVIAAINKGRVYCYLNKPWDEQELKVILKNSSEICITRRLLKEKQEMLQKTNNELEKFVYSASHDLRAPLMSIKGIINFAKTQSNYPEQEYLPMIERSIDRLDVFIGSIINYYQNVRLEIQPSELDFKKMIQETWHSFDHVQERAKIRFDFHVQQDHTFKSDEFRLQVILNNLFLNAIRYQRKNDPEQFISVAVDVEDKFATLSVKDGGIGIDPEHMDRIFDMFYRATQEKPGSGLGLYITKEAVEKIGGEIEVKSQPGKGTTFKVIIPNQM
jgi:two-component system sensor histidine kinase/response regulator